MLLVWIFMIFPSHEVFWSIVFSDSFHPVWFSYCTEPLLYKWVLQSKINDKTFCRFIVFWQVESCFEAHQTAVTIYYPQLISIIIQMGCRYATWLKLNKTNTMWPRTKNLAEVIFNGYHLHALYFNYVTSNLCLYEWIF